MEKTNVSRDNYINISDLIEELMCSRDLPDSIKFELVAIIAKHEATEHDYMFDQFCGVINAKSEE